MIKFIVCYLMLLTQFPIFAKEPTYCDQLPKLDFDLRKFYTRYSGKITQYKSLNQGQECSRLEFNATDSIKTIISPTGTRNGFYSERVRAGVFQGKHVITGELSWDSYFAQGETKDGGYYCLYICDCFGGLAYPRRIHCDVSNKKLIPRVNEALKELNPALKESQQFFECNMNEDMGNKYSRNSL